MEVVCGTDKERLHDTCLDSDVIEFQGLVEADRPALREGVILSGCEYKSIATIRKNFQTLGADVSGSDSDIGIPLPDGVDNFHAHSFTQVDINIRMSHEGFSENPGKKVCYGSCVSEDANVTGKSSLVLLQSSFHSVVLLQQKSTVMKKCPPGGRESDSLTVPVEQFYVEAIFERFDSLTCGRK